LVNQDTTDLNYNARLKLNRGLREHYGGKQTSMTNAVRAASI